jgi:hypothetical protein
MNSFADMACGISDVQKAQWVRRHNDSEPIGSEDYIRIRLNGELYGLVLYLQPEHAERLAQLIDSALQDRAVTLDAEQADTVQVNPENFHG